MFRLGVSFDAEAGDRLFPQELLQARQNHAARACDFKRPTGVRRADGQHATREFDRRDAGERGSDDELPRKVGARRRRRLPPDYVSENASAELMNREHSGPSVRHGPSAIIFEVSFILASASPRRAELLAAAGFAFEVVAADVDETPLPGEPPKVYALRVARAKAEEVGRRVDAGRTILAADTVVVAGDRLMGKPVDDRDAASMLRALSGRVHEVHTAVVMRGAVEHEDVVTTAVRFNPLSDAEIDWYISTGEAAGKAGAYAIQGRAARFIDRIDGSWSNVVGLPIATVYRLLSPLVAGSPSGVGSD